MKKFTNLLLIFMMGVFALMPFSKVNAKEPANIYIFYGATCPHCEAAMKYFDSLEEEYGDMFNLVKYEVWSNEDNANLMQTVASKMGEKADGVPYIIIGDKTFSGYASTYDEEILNAIEDLYDSDDRYDVIKDLDSNTSGTSTVVYITLGVIVIGLVSILGFSKAKAN